MKQRMGLSIKVTTECQRHCGDKCGVSSWMDRKPGYEMSMEHLHQMVFHARNAGYKFEFIIFTGGEPFLWWPWIVKAADLIRGAGITRALTVYTNGLEVNRILNAASLFDNIKITRYWYNTKEIERLKHLPNVKIKTLDYWNKHLEEPARGVLPADCGCKAFSMQADRFYLCSVQPILDADKKQGIPLQKDFLAKLRDQDPFNRPICARCFGNLKVAKLSQQEKGESHD
jgi:hypothetical protein